MVKPEFPFLPRSLNLSALVARKNDPLLRLVKNSVKTAYQANFEFFGFNIPRFTVQLLYKRKEMDGAMKEKTASWVVGTCLSSARTICIFSPSVFEKVSPHKKHAFLSVFTHELTHLFAHEIYPSYEPMWLGEGLADVIASQGNPKENLSANVFFNDYSFLQKLSLARDWQKNAQCGAYQISFHWINYLIEKFGKDKLLNLMKDLSKTQNINKSFKLIYSKPLRKTTHDFFKEKGKGYARINIELNH